MKNIVVIRVILLAALVAACVAVTLGTRSTSSAATAAACRCPLIYAPVVCDNGKSYPNQCVADCHHARGCVPSGI